MSDVSELAKIEDMIFTSGNLSGELRKDLDSTTETVLHSDLNMDRSQDKDVSNSSDMADLKSVMKTAATGINGVTDLDRSVSSPGGFISVIKKSKCKPTSQVLEVCKGNINKGIRINPCNIIKIETTKSLPTIFTTECDLEKNSDGKDMSGLLNRKLTSSLLASTTANMIIQNASGTTKSVAAATSIIAGGLHGTPFVNSIINDSSTNSSTATISDGAKCRVCGDNSSGVHYGVETCEGCKGFFRRALTDNSQVKMRCVNRDKRCDVLPETRNRCQYCRLLKCLRLGMSRTAAKMGRRKSRMSTSMMGKGSDNSGDEIGTQGDLHQHQDSVDIVKDTSIDSYETEQDVSNELERARARDLVLMNRRGGGISSGPCVINSGIQVNSRTGLQSGMGLSRTVGGGQDEPDSTNRFDLGGSNVLDDSTTINIDPERRGQALASQLIALQSACQNNGNSFVIINPLTTLRPSSPGNNIYSKSPPKKRPFPPNLTPLSSLSKLDKTADHTDNLQIINMNNVSQQSQHRADSSSNNSQLQQALGVQQNATSLYQLASTVEIAFQEIYQQHIDSQGCYSRTQISQLNENSINILFSDQMRKAQNNVQVSHRVQNLVWESFHVRFNEIIQDVVKFAKRIPGFAELDTDDRVNLVRNGCFEVGCIVHHFYIDPETESWMGNRGFVLLRNQMRSIMPVDEIFTDMLFEHSIRLQEFRLTLAEIGLLCAAMLINPDRTGLINREKVGKLQEELLLCLQHALLSRAACGSPGADGSPAPGPALLPRLLLSVAAPLRELSIEHRRQIRNIKGRYDFPNDLYAETFDLI